MNTKKIYYLKNCDTSRKVIQQANLSGEFELRDIKEDPLSPEEVDHLAILAGSYEALFSRRSREYHRRDLKNQYLNEKDYRELILEHYSFLKRPAVVIDDQIFIGGNESVINRLIYYLEQNQD